MFRKIKEFIKSFFKEKGDGVYSRYDGETYIIVDGEVVYDSRYDGDKYK